MFSAIPYVHENKGRLTLALLAASANGQATPTKLRPAMHRTNLAWGYRGASRGSREFHKNGLHRCIRVIFPESAMITQAGSCQHPFALQHYR